jgi:mitotic spindle assembly checkpoint protein MAD2B
MTGPPPRPPILNTYTSLLTTLSSFLTVSIHTLLYERALYPATTFISARAYNFPVRQNRHPKVCQWINDAVAAVEKEMAAGRVERIGFVIYDIGEGEVENGHIKGRKDVKVVEKWVFDVGSWPVVQRSDRLVEFEDSATDKGKGKAVETAPADAREEQKNSVRVQMVDIEEQVRATIRKLAYTAEKMPPLPEGCTYTVIVELRDEAEPPIGHPQPWVPSEPSIQKTRDRETGETTRGSALDGARSIPIRAVESGAFVLETWVEQAS